MKAEAGGGQFTTATEAQLLSEPQAFVVVKQTA